jgi:hypothetical protein
VLSALESTVVDSSFGNCRLGSRALGSFRKKASKARYMNLRFVSEATTQGGVRFAKTV